MVISRSIFEVSHMKAIPVIASFANDGKIQPLYIRIDDVSLKVLSYYKIEETIAGLHYNCCVEDNGISKTIVLYYSIKEHAWFLESDYKPFN